MDLGSGKPTSVPMEKVYVTINPDVLIGNYGEAFVHEGYRTNPLRAEQVGLTAQEVTDYITYLLTQRVKMVNLNCPDYRKLKSLYIPSYVQYTLTTVGRTYLRKFGLEFLPVMSEESKMTFEQAAAISDKIGAFIDDLQIVRDGMPRDIEGDVDVMSTAIVADYVRGIYEVTHISSTYVSAFLGLKLRQEADFAALYRIQYDDLEFIQSALTTQKGLFH